MRLTSDSFKDMAAIPGRCAFAVPDPAQHIKLSDNKNPHLAWGDLPAGTKSLALICHDVDVPSKGDDVNKEGRQIPATLPRVDFFHWVLVDLNPDAGSIREGEFSSAVTPRGKKGPEAARGARQGINDYSAWFAGDKDMGGNYFGYERPCPPWNDEILHHYMFTIYALDVARCPVEGNFYGAAVLKAIDGHVLDKASITGIYTLNPKLG